MSGGIFLDMTCHDFDMARYVTGSEVVEVYAQGAVRVDPAIGEAGDLDTAVLTLRHADGCLTVIDNSRQAAYGYDQRVEAFGDARHGDARRTRRPHRHVLTADGMHGPALPHFFVERYTPSYVLQWEAFAATCGPAGPSPVSGADGRAPLPSGWRRGSRSARAGPSRSDPARPARQVGDDPAVDHSDGVRAERHLHRLAHRLAGEDVEAPVVLRALDAPVEQQPVGELRLACVHIPSSST